ncbi:MAG: hypothetical protein ACP5IK_04035, partial [Candidatus Micrarchaeia archaeon]
GLAMALAYGIGSLFAYIGGILADLLGKKNVALLGNLLIPILSFTGFSSSSAEATALFSAGWWARNFRTPARRAMIGDISSRLDKGKVYGFLNALDIRSIGVSARIVSGVVKTGSTFYSSSKPGIFKIDRLYAKGALASFAKSGQNAIIFSKGMPDTGVIFERESAVKPKKSVHARIFAVEDLSLPLSARILDEEVRCTSIKVEKLFNFDGGKALPFIGALEGAESEIKMEKDVPVMPFDSLPELGRIVFYKDGRFAGVGIVDRE